MSSNNGLKISLFFVSVILAGLIFYFFRKPSMLHALTDINTPADVVRIFPTSVSQLKSNLNPLIENTKKEIEAIIAIPDHERTYANTITAFDQLLGFSDLAVLGSVAQTIELSNPDEKMRNAAREVMVSIENYLIEVTSDKKLYHAIKAYVEGNAKNENLTPEQKYYLAELMKDFERSGLNLPDEKLEEVKRVKKELAQLSTDFEKNIAEDQRKVIVNKDGLKGLSESFINSFSKDAEGNYTLPVNNPTYVQVMENCENANTRKNMWYEYSNRAFPINKDVLEKVIAKRYELAQLLGFKTYAALELDDKMVKNPARAQKFLNGIEAKATAKASSEIKEFTKDIPESVTLVNDGRLYPWDNAFLRNYYKKKVLNVDENKVAEYFPVQHTIDALLNIYQDFFNLEFKQLPTKGFWDPEVKLIEVIDKEKNQPMGYIILDLFPRQGKYTHAAQQAVIPAIYRADGTTNKAVVFVIANFPKATAESPALLKYRDVTTFFHEFGHGMHTLFGRTKMVSHAGPHGVKRDFVEMPSQMLEEWMRDRQILKMVSHHYQTGQPMPDDMIDALLKIRIFDSGMYVSRQLYLANFSLDCFNSGPHVDLVALRKKLFDKLIIGTVYSPEDHQFASFGHLMGYGSAYYGYLWSEVFAHDLFGIIEKEGLLNPAIGRRYAETVLGKGGSKDPNELLKDFLGREPNQNAYMKAMGF